MANQPRMSTGFRNALLNSDVQTAFDSGTLRLFANNGPQPASADDTEGSATIIATMTLPADAFGTAANGLVAKAGTWEDTSADAGGTMSWFRLYASPGTQGASTTLVRLDGTIGTSDADLIIGNLVVVSTDPITIDTFTITINAKLTSDT